MPGVDTQQAIANAVPMTKNFMTSKSDILTAKATRAKLQAANAHFITISQERHNGFANDSSQAD
jgi:hypothetical protein